MSERLPWLFTGGVWKWGFWFRIWGRGLWLAIDDGSKLFSERHGFGPFRFLVLMRVHQ